MEYSPLEHARELHDSMKNIPDVTSPTRTADGLRVIETHDKAIRAALKKAGADLTALYAPGAANDARNPNRVTIKEAETRYEADIKEAKANLADKFVDLAKEYQAYLKKEVNLPPDYYNSYKPDQTNERINQMLAEANKLGKDVDLTVLHPGLTLPEATAAQKQITSHAHVRDAAYEKNGRDREVGVDYKGEGRFSMKTVDPMIKRALERAGYSEEGAGNPLNFVPGKLDSVKKDSDKGDISSLPLKSKAQGEALTRK